MLNRIKNKTLNNLLIYKKDIRTKGLYWSIIHRLYKINWIKKVITPIVNTLKPNYIIIQGNKLYIDKKDAVVSQELVISGTWEEYETEVFKKNINKGDTVLDIGAHIGYYTLIAAQLVGDKGKVYAFEPDHKNFSLLKKNVEVNGYKNVVLVNKAVGEIDGKIELYLDDENTGDHRIYVSDARRKGITIEVVTLNNFLKNNEEVNLIKMDIQGSESSALKGGSNIIKENKSIKILTEFWPKGLKLSGSSSNEFINLLIKNKFYIYDINESDKKMKLLNTKTLLSEFDLDKREFLNLFCTHEQLSR